MADRKKGWSRVSLRRKVMVWFLAILSVLIVTLGTVIAISQTTFDETDLLLQDNVICCDAQEAIENEQKAFESYIREASQENMRNYQEACAASRRCVGALPFDCGAIGEERYARTWNIVHGYEGYREARDRLIAMEPDAEGYVDELYRVRQMQEYLSDYALRLVQVTLEENNHAYTAKVMLFEILPWFFLLLLGAAVLVVVYIMRLLSVSVVRPTLLMAGESRRIAENDFSGPDLEVRSADEMGELTAAFNRMKHATAEHISTLEALHREEVSRLETEKNLERTRLEMLKSQVNPHFLFNTLNMISCMARLEEAETTNRMILALGNLFRYNLRTKAQEVYLEQELEALEDYIYIQQMRFDGRVRYRRIIRVDEGKVRIPSFTLQPLAENAFVHGLGYKEEKGSITLRIWQEDGAVIVSMADNGKGMTDRELEELRRKISRSEQTGRGIGLGNISRRIAMLYPEGGLRIYSRPGRGTVIQLVIPQERERDVNV